MSGVEVGLVLALALFAINYSRIELVREVPFGSTHRSNVDRPASERLALETLADRVQILRVSGFVFFGTASGLLERIRKRAEGRPIRFLLVDLRRVTGMDSSAVLSFRKLVQFAEGDRVQLIFSGASQRVLGQLRRGGVAASAGVVSFVPDLDQGLEACEDGLLVSDEWIGRERGGGQSMGELRDRLGAYVERVSLPEGAVLIHQEQPPDDVFVLESGRLKVEMTTPEGERLRLRSMRAGVVVGEVALYTGVPRTADVVAETPSVVLRLSQASIDRMEAADPELAVELHRWLATTLAERLRYTLNAFDTLFD